MPWIVAAIAPGAQRYVLHVLIFTSLYAALALSYDLVIGHVGNLSLAHPAFFGIGAYAAALLGTEARWPFSIVAPRRGGGGRARRARHRVPMFRLTEHSFAMGTLGFAVVVQIVATNWVDFTRGPLCVTGIPKPALGPGASRRCPRSTGWACRGDARRPLLSRPHDVPAGPRLPRRA